MIQNFDTARKVGRIINLYQTETDKSKKVLMEIYIQSLTEKLESIARGGKSA